MSGSFNQSTKNEVPGAIPHKSDAQSRHGTEDKSNGEIISDGAVAASDGIKLGNGCDDVIEILHEVG